MAKVGLKETLALLAAGYKKKDIEALAEIDDQQQEEKPAEDPVPVPAPAAETPKQEEPDYKKMYEGRYLLLRKAYERSNISQNGEYQRFMAENNWWLSDYALFMAVKDRFGGVPWTEWAEDIRLRWKNAMEYYRRELYFDIEFQQYMQFLFFKQWKALKDYANHN